MGRAPEQVEKFTEEWVKPALDDDETRGRIGGGGGRGGGSGGARDARESELYAWRSFETSSGPECVEGTL